MKRLIMSIGFPILLFSFANLSFAATTQVDALIEKLVDKGILNRQEAIALKAEVIEDEKIVREEGLKQSLPKWVQNINFKGDLRLRYQGEHRDIDSAGGTGERLIRNRMRYRLRAGIDAKVLDNMNVAFGLGSGSDGDPRSTNQTMQDSFAKKPIWIDYAYAQWMPIKELALTGGKIKNPFWLASDFLWDSDINPEGGALQASYKPVPSVNLFFNTAGLIVDEIGADVDDPWMIGLQGGFDWYFMPETADVKIAFTGYDLFNETGKIPDWSAGTNTRRAGGDGIRYDFMPFTLDTTIGFKKPFAGVTYLGDYVRYAGVFANGVFNPFPDKDRTGGLIGCVIGDEKVSKKGQWQAKGSYRYLERDAWPDFLPDSDFYYGGTNVMGPEVILEYGLMDNVVLAFDYYNCKNIDGPGRPLNLWQFDVNWKF